MGPLTNWQATIDTSRINYISYSTRPTMNFPKIKRVIFNAPATIVIWDDNTKTVVKSGDYDVYDPEKGLAMAISKKALGNTGAYYNTFKKHLPEEDNAFEEGMTTTIKKTIENINSIKFPTIEVTIKK